jgi:hypothetical protein
LTGRIFGARLTCRCSIKHLQETLLGLKQTGPKPPLTEIQAWQEFAKKLDLLFAAIYHKQKAKILREFAPFDPNQTLGMLEVRCACSLDCVGDMLIFRC